MNTSTKIPIADGVPILGSLRPLSRDLLTFMASQYRKHGPIFQVNILHKKFYAMVGPKANEFMKDHGMEYLTTEKSWKGFSDAFKAEKFIISNEGKVHFEMRRIMRKGYSPSILTGRIDEACRIIDEEINGLKKGDTFSVVDLTRKIVVRQLGILVANYDPKDYFKDLQVFTRYLLNMVGKRWLGVNRFSPVFIKARKRAYELAKIVIADHKKSHPERKPDLIDDILAAKISEKDFFNENELIGATLGPFMAGMDTVVNTISFMLFTSCSKPAIMNQVKGEIKGLFQDDIPNLKELRRAATLHKVALETMRMYPVAPALVRTAIKDFEFEGKLIKKDSEILVASVVTHFLEECFPNPEVFDISRYNSDQNAHRNPINYVPFGIGTHTCLGNRLAEVLLALNYAYILSKLDVELADPNYKITMDPDPTPGPSSDFRLRVTNVNKQEKEMPV